MAVSEAHKRASNKWNSSRDNIMIRPDKETGAAIRAAAAVAGMSVQAYVLQAVRERMEREGSGAVPADGSPAVSPERAGEGTGTQGTGVMVFSDPLQDENICSRFISQSPPASTTGQPDEEPG